MIRAASVLLLVAMLCVAAPVFAQPAPPVATPTRQAFQALVLGMTREMVSKLVSSQGPMDTKQEVWTMGTRSNLGTVGGSESPFLR